MTPDELGGGDHAVAVLGVATARLPGLASLMGAQRETALAILRGAVSRAQRAGIQSRRAGDWSWEYSDAEAGLLTDDELRALRALTGETLRRAGGPRGCFPRPRPIWPRERH